VEGGRARRCVCAGLVVASLVLVLTSGAVGRSQQVTRHSPHPSSVSGAWYASTSAFNTPIPANVAIRPNNSSLINAMQNVFCTGNGCVAPADYFSTPSVWIADNSTPLVTVEINYPSVCRQSTVQVPIPAGAIASHPGDPEPVMAILQADTGEEWDFYKVTPPGVKPVNSTGPQNCPADTQWQAVIVAHHSPGWTGSGSELSTRESGTLNGAGLIRPRDWEMPAGSTWDHALAFAYPGTLVDSHVWPAIADDGNTCNDTSSCIPQGARFQLDPSVNCATWPSLTSEFVRQLCRTLQKYGMIVVCNGSGLITENSVSAQSTDSSADSFHDGQTAPWNVSPYIQYLPQDLVAKLRVIDGTKWTGA
jgi:hypothetical protein